MVLAEAVRVARVGGRVAVLEANGETVMARAFGLLFRHERGLLGNRFERIVGDLKGAGDVEMERAQRIEPAPFYRLAFHHRFGQPKLARSARAIRVVEAIERFWSRCGAAGSYVLCVARRRS